MFALVWLRGSVGVDLPMYIQSIEMIQESKSYKFIFEPGFETLILTLGQIVNSPMITVNIIATITTALILKTDWQTKTAYQTIGLGVIPYFYLDMTMNGLRYGLAFAIIIGSLNSFVRAERFRNTLATLLAVATQVSSLYLSAMLQMMIKSNWRYFLFALAIFPVIFLMGSGYFLIKASVNFELAKPSISAGIAPLFLSLVILAGCWSSEKILNYFRVILVILFILSLCTYVATQFSYAGLRLQQMNYFLILLFVIYSAEVLKVKTSWLLSVALILVAVFGSILRLNNFHSEAGVGEAPFVPYKLFWSK